MEPTNHPFRKENDIPNLHEDMFHVNLQGCMFQGLWPLAYDRQTHLIAFVECQQNKFTTRLFTCQDIRLQNGC